MDCFNVTEIGTLKGDFRKIFFKHKIVAETIAKLWLWSLRIVWKYRLQFQKTKHGKDSWQKLMRSLGLLTKLRTVNGWLLEIGTVYDLTQIKVQSIHESVQDIFELAQKAPMISITFGL